MRLSKEEVEKVSRLILARLKERGLIIFKVEEGVVLARIIELFTKDLKDEDALDREVEEIMKNYAMEIEKGRLDYRKMFNLIKNKLAKERGMVL